MNVGDSLSPVVDRLARPGRSQSLLLLSRTFVDFSYQKFVLGVFVFSSSTSSFPRSMQRERDTHDKSERRYTGKRHTRTGGTEWHPAPKKFHVHIAS